MKLIKSSFEILQQEPGLDGIYSSIELAGRTCYRSSRPEDKTAKDFVDMLIKRGHLSPLEHGTVYLQIPLEEDLGRNKYDKNPYSKVNYISRLDSKQAFICVTTNYRVLLENNWLDDLKYLCEPTGYHAKRVTVKFVCDRGVSHELVRHRVFSFAQESTRYCNYSKNKFGNELTFIIPSWYEQFKRDKLDDTGHRPDGTSDMFVVEDDFIDLLRMSEAAYNSMLIAGGTPQQARQVLPNALKTEVVMTGFLNDWKHFFDLRCSPAAHPDMIALAKPLKEEFIKRKFL